MKAILVVDNPTSCRECMLRTTLEANKFHCLAILPRKEIKPYEEQKPSWCPLKPMPEPKDIGYPNNDYDVGFGDGWDACLKEIEK